MSTPFINNSANLLFVTNVFSVATWSAFAHEFPAHEFQLNRELISYADDIVPGDWPANYLMWRYWQDPVIPYNHAAQSLLSLLPEYLEVGHAAIFAFIPPGKSLDESFAVMVGFDSKVLLGTIAQLTALATPYQYAVGPFDERVMRGMTAGLV